MAKLPKSEVEYEHPAKGINHCGMCRHFEVEAPGHCEIVAGRILPEDWCDHFRRKSLYEKRRA